MILSTLNLTKKKVLKSVKDEGSPFTRIEERKAESQSIVATRLLYDVRYLVLI